MADNELSNYIEGSILEEIVRKSKSIYFNLDSNKCITIYAKADCCGDAWFYIPRNQRRKFKLIPLGCEIISFEIKVIPNALLPDGRKLVGDDSYYECNDCEDVKIYIEFVDKGKKRNRIITVKLMGAHNGYYPPYIDIELRKDLNQYIKFD